MFVVASEMAIRILEISVACSITEEMKSGSWRREVASAGKSESGRGHTLKRMARPVSPTPTTRKVLRAFQ